MKGIQKKILYFLENEICTNDDFQNLADYLKSQKITENLHEFKEFLHLITNISKNHRITPHFRERFEQIVIFFKKDICEKFSNFEIFNYFVSNKRAILFLFQNEIIFPDQAIASILSNDKYFERKYPHFLFPEISTFLSHQKKLEIEKYSSNYTHNLDKFERYRDLGENDSFLCNLIRNDLNDDFISHVSKTNLMLSTTISPSIFETDSFLLKNNPTLIEYSAFFGSVHIFKYLFLNKVELKPSLWLYAIHSGNPEIIHLLEEGQVMPPGGSYKMCLIESIKCHHNEIANYFNMKLNLNQFEMNIENEVFIKSLQYYNYKYFSHEICNYQKNFLYLCKNDYFGLINFFLNENENAQTISILFIF